MTIRSKETDPRRISQRRKQIDLGKNTAGYATYTSVIPKCKRRADLAFSKHPITPDPTEKCSKRRFDGKLRVWRRGIHSFEEAYESGMMGTAVVGMKGDTAPTAGPSALPKSNHLTAPSAGARACSNQHAKSNGKDTKTEDALLATKGLSKAKAHNAAAPYSVIVSEDFVPSKRITAENTKKTTAKFETPRKKVLERSPLIRPGSSGKENFDLSRSAKKRAAAQREAILRLDNAAAGAAGGRDQNVFATTGYAAPNFDILQQFEKSAGGSLNMPAGFRGQDGSGLVCTGGVCMLPDARTGALGSNIEDLKLKRDASQRIVLGEINANVAGDGIAQSRAGINTEVPERRTIEEFMRMQAAQSGGVGVGVPRSAKNISVDPTAGLASSIVDAPKCARYNEGACEVGATQCEYRHEVWTFAERVEYEARRAFSENSRILEQNSALLNRLREQDLLIADQSTEISALLEEIHRLRQVSHRLRGTTAQLPGGARRPSLICASPSRAAATIARTALRRTPLRAGSSRPSFSGTPLRSQRLRSSRATRTTAGAARDRNADILNEIVGLEDVVYDIREEDHDEEDEGYESIHGRGGDVLPASIRLAKGPHGVGFGRL